MNVEARTSGSAAAASTSCTCNLTRGLGGEGGDGAHVMKLNYTSLQHAVQPVEEGLEDAPRGRGHAGRGAGAARPAAVRGVRARRAARPGARVGYVQTAGGALPGELSDMVAELLERGLLAGPRDRRARASAAPHEAITVEGALDAGRGGSAGTARSSGPGPGILGSASALGHGGLAALANAHAALALGCPVVLVPRLSSGDPRERHRGLSHHTDDGAGAAAARRCAVPVPAGLSLPSGAALERAVARGGHDGVRGRRRRSCCDAYLASGLPATHDGALARRGPRLLPARRWRAGPPGAELTSKGRCER